MKRIDKAFPIRSCRRSLSVRFFGYKEKNKEEKHQERKLHCRKKEMALFHHKIRAKEGEDSRNSITEEDSSLPSFRHQKIVFQIGKGIKAASKNHDTEGNLLFCHLSVKRRP